MLDTISHLTLAELEAGLDGIRQSPKESGVLRLIVRRPRIEAREVLAAAELHPDQGLIGDNWISRGSSKTPDGSAHPDMQLNIMNARVAALVAQREERWQLAGDQLYVDYDLSEANLPAGTRLAIGDAVIVVSPQPHTGCQKFSGRFGVDALRLVGTPEGKALRLRGANARVVVPGPVRRGDQIRRA